MISKCLYNAYEYVDIKAPISIYYQYYNKYSDKIDKPMNDEYITTNQEWAKNSGLLSDDDIGFLA